jgi:hypothetical protein
VADDNADDNVASRGLPAAEWSSLLDVVVVWRTETPFHLKTREASDYGSGIRREHIDRDRSLLYHRAYLLAVDGLCHAVQAVVIRHLDYLLMGAGAFRRTAAGGPMPVGYACC